VDGPRRKFVQRGEGSYYLSTDNLPCFPPFALAVEEPPPDPRLKGDFEACWEIVQYNDGRVEILANRPTLAEIMDGDLFGALGTSITLPQVSRHRLKMALRVARKLCQCDPTKGISITFSEYAYIGIIYSNIPVYLS
jgi:hypothetical protein